MLFSFKTQSLIKQLDVIENKLMQQAQEEDYIEEEDLEEEDYSFSNYEITSSPNDFNVATLFSFIEKGVFEIPGFQRNYVWSLIEASKLIESLILGLPIPQIFLYEQERNKFLVVDGQQRLMSIYFFMKGRFPRMEKRNELKTILQDQKRISDEVFENDTFFSDFKLELRGKLPKEEVTLRGLSYQALPEFSRTGFELRTIRCVVVKQISPKEEDGDSSIFEIFNRLNAKAVNLTPQEIRFSLYRSDFMKSITRLNLDPRWRNIMGKNVLHTRMKDVEILLRCAAMLDRGEEEYKPSMTRFLNQFAKDMKKYDQEHWKLFEKLTTGFFELCNSQDLSASSFTNSQQKKANISILESVYYAACHQGYRNKTGQVEKLDKSFIKTLRDDKEFQKAIASRRSSTEEVKTRLRRARELWEQRYHAAGTP